ncbi:MAG: ATP-binding protein [Actinomycetota bacterium]|nr:ATP-binding protein [Actinomycetota bacterium]
MSVFVLVGGWPGSGKSTLARALAPELHLPLLAKDEIKEALTDELGQPQTVADSQRLGRIAVLLMLRIAGRCPGAVLDSTWFDYTRPLLSALPGPLVEVRCLLPREVARARYRARAAARHPGHLDHLRDDDELWGRPVLPLHVGPLLAVDTSASVDPTDLPAALRRWQPALATGPVTSELSLAPPTEGSACGTGY